MDKIASIPSETYTYVEILNKQLYFAVLKAKSSKSTTKLKSTMDTFFFSIDDELIYENYYADFGPLNISCLYKYCCKLRKYLQYAKGVKQVVHYTCGCPEKKTNSATLMGLFCVIFLKMNPKDVWRLLQELGPYKFTQVGIQHYDLIFPDGTTPPKDILLKFLNISEMASAAIAVHCKAGLGRTGSLIGAYLVKHYHMTAKEAIAWMRICRPGSVIGQQQIWLEKLETWLWRLGNQFRALKYGDGDKIPKHKYGIYSKIWPKEREKLINGARKKIQKSFTKVQLEKLSKQKRLSMSLESVVRKGVDGVGPESMSVFSVDARNPFYSTSSVSSPSKYLHRNNKTYPDDVTQNSSYGLPNWKNTAEYSKLHHPQPTLVKFPVTQGDKLNEIKTSRF
ncbi:hypothetical protein NQ315_009119, partial [Exocentrus adspersus]